MGAAGLTSSSAEMAARGDVGVTIDVTKVPVRESGMTPYEILLSESQERMLVVARRGHEDAVRAILAKWDLAAAVIGAVIAEPVYRVTEGDRVVAEFPGSRLVTECPHLYADAARTSAIVAAARDGSSVRSDRGQRSVIPTWTLLALLGSPTIASKAWVTRQYDTSVRTSTVVGTGRGDAAVVRFAARNARSRSRPTATGATPISTRASAAASRSPRPRGTWPASAARPMAITNCLNFGNPTRPEIYYQLREAIAGMGEACRALGTPVTGGNVSLYNESPAGAVYPTPVVGMVGLDRLASRT